MNKTLVGLKRRTKLSQVAYLAVALLGAWPTISSAVVRHRETWDATASGWLDRDAAKMTVAHSAGVGFPAGSLMGVFAEQGGVPIPETDAFRATVASSGGAFTGNYWEHYAQFHGWTFHFRAADVLPSTLQVRFYGAGSVFFANVLPQVTSVGGWHAVTTPTTHAGGWFGGTAAQWSNALAAVEWVEVQVSRNGEGAQAFYLDNFDNNLPEIRRSALGDRIWFDANGNGIQDAGETFAISGMPVALLNASSNIVLATTSTDANGNYLFTELLASNYVVRFTLSTEPGLMPSPKHQGGDPALDSDAATNSSSSVYAWTDPVALGVGQTNRTVDLGLMGKDGTRAELAGVWGEWTEGEARVGWHTSSEWGTAGFHLYRVEANEGREERVTGHLVPSEFPEAGAVYEVVDPQGQEGAAAVYRLEEIELTGRVRDLGTHEVVFGAPAAKLKAARAKVGAAKVPKALPLPAARQAPGPSPVVKVRTSDEGIHAIALPSLADRMGRGIESVRELAAAGSLALTCRGEPVPVVHDASRDRLVFHVVPPAPNAYGREAVVRIAVGPGASMARRAPGATGGSAVRPERKRFEQDLYIGNAALPVLPDYNYYWNSLVGTTSTIGGWRNFGLDLSGHAGGAVTLKVRLMGWTSTSADPDHRAEFRFNGTALGSLEFDGQEIVTAELTVPSGLAVDGVNTLSVRSVLMPGRSHSVFALDWIEARHDRVVKPGAGTLHVDVEGAAAVSAAAFAQPFALALDEESRPVWIADAQGALPSKAWAVAAGDERFAVVEAAEIPLLEPEAAAAEAWFLSSTNRIDYLVVVPRALETAVQELAEYRAGQGLRVGVAVFEDVCDLLAGGVRTPEAIAKLLAYASGTWEESPWLVVLAGSGHLDYRGTMGAKACHLPPVLVQTTEGVCAADGRLGDLDGDGRPEVAIGRLPAQSAEDLAAMVAKIKAFEAQFGADWQNELVLVADAADSGNDFGPATDRLAGLVADPYVVADRIEVDALGVAAAGGRLKDWLQAGAGFVHFTGHGGVENLGAGHLVTTEDAAALDNAGRPSVVVALSCLAARFEEPGAESLGEALLRQPGGGAVAVLGPSGLSRNDPAADLGEAFYRAIFHNRVGTLGLAFLQARRSLPRSAMGEDTHAIYNLLGDPALRIAGNTGGGPADARFSQWRWERYAPDDLAMEDLGAHHGRFAEYAFGTDGALGLAPAPASPGASGLILTWRRRIHRQDVDYRFHLTENLVDWILAPAESLPTIGVDSDAEGIMETVRTRVEWTNAPRLFMGIEAIRK